MSLALLLSGNFIEGWKEFDWRRKIGSISFQRDFSQPIWNGSEIAGLTILLCAEYGFGDTIQFVRYAPLVAERGARVIVECPKELTSLIKNCEGAHQVIAYGEQLPEFDTYCPLLRLPLVFHTTLETIPAKLAYISVDLMLVEKWRDKFSHNNSKLKIGLAWGGRPRYRTLRHRSCSFEIFSALSNLDDTAFYSLQKGEAAKEAKHPPTGMNFYDYTQEIKDFSDTAALIENLDLIISVDTAVAHLAGALGKPVWTLLPFAADWRWLLEREDSPWYPTMRLFRQPSHGDWEAVISRVFDHVRRKISANLP